EDVFVDVGYLLQPHLVLGNDPTAAPEFTSDFYLRRSRLMLGGQVSPFVSFFVATDMPNWGKGGDWSNPDLLVQDAVVSFGAHEAFRVSVGMLLIPFVHQAKQDPGTLHTLDFHDAVLRSPTGVARRDNGIEFRGLLAGGRLDYRVAITNGVAGTPHDIPRLSGRVAVNFADAEPGLFLGGTHLGDKKVVSIGAAFDAQPEAFGGADAYYAFGGDFFLDVPMGGNRLSSQVNYVYYGGSANPDAGMGVLFDLGYAIGKLEPLVAVDWFMPRGAAGGDDHLFGGHVGLNWWLIGHRASIKLDLGIVKEPGEGISNAARVATIQTQLLL
ncbi:MAG: hypothetical protein QGH45_05170, partial [Myxococcota bacterium]|nr:hypothetical protein [Myxococcota bacterium]